MSKERILVLDTMVRAYLCILGCVTVTATLHRQVNIYKVHSRSSNSWVYVITVSELRKRVISVLKTLFGSCIFIQTMLCVCSWEGGVVCLAGRPDEGERRKGLFHLGRILGATGLGTPDYGHQPWSGRLTVVRHGYGGPALQWSSPPVGSTAAEGTLAPTLSSLLTMLLNTVHTDDKEKRELRTVTFIISSRWIILFFEVTVFAAGESRRELLCVWY